MKTKLSLLVLPLSLCLGLALTVASCGDNSPTGSKGNGGSGSSSSYSAPPDKPSEGVKINGFDITSYTLYASITGTVQAVTPNLITKVTYSGVDASWISRADGKTGAISVDNAKVFDLTAEIDFRNKAIGCDREYTVTIEARTSRDSVTRESKTFKKPEALCAQQNSSGSGEPSSSSLASWKFGSPSTGEITAGTPVAIGSGSATFELLGDGEIVDQPDLKISGGNVRIPIALCGDDNPTVGEHSPDRQCLGSEKATQHSLSDIGQERVSGPDYYLVYLDDGSIYLLQFTKRDGASWSNWPLKYIFWPATDYPRP